MKDDLHIWLPLCALAAILLVYLPWMVRKHRKMQTGDVSYASVPLLSYGISISVFSFAVFVVLFGMLMLTAGHQPDATHSFRVGSLGGGQLYAHPILASSILAGLLQIAVFGVDLPISLVTDTLCMPFDLWERHRMNNQTGHDMARECPVCSHSSLVRQRRQNTSERCFHSFQRLPYRRQYNDTGKRRMDNPRRSP